jgi:hypothetical protein
MMTTTTMIRRSLKSFLPDGILFSGMKEGYSVLVVSQRILRAANRPHAAHEGSTRSFSQGTEKWLRYSTASYDLAVVCLVMWGQQEEVKPRKGSFPLKRITVFLTSSMKP